MSTLINDPFLGRIVQDILDELTRSKALHPNYPADTLRRESIIMEEILEALHEMTGHAMTLQQITLGVTRISAKDSYTMAELRKELVQVATMCVKFLESMDIEARKANVGDY